MFYVYFTHDKLKDYVTSRHISMIFIYEYFWKSVYLTQTLFFNGPQLRTVWL